ncbi:MAG: hypothetical protein ABI234_05055 [Ktedonobacteraceae bacterium]
MQNSQKSCGQEEAPVLAMGRELMEDELAVIYGGQNGSGKSVTLSGLNGFESLVKLLNSHKNDSLTSLSDLMNNQSPALNKVPNLAQLLPGFDF